MATSTTEDPFLLAIAAFACLFDARLADETRAARGGEAQASVAVTPPPLPPMVLHAAAPKQGFDPDLPPSRWLPSVARAVRQRRKWGADELLKAMQYDGRRTQTLTAAFVEWRIADLIAAWLAVESSQATRNSTPPGSTQPSVPLQCLVEYPAWHRRLRTPLGVHERDTIAATLIQLLRARPCPEAILTLICKTFTEMLTESSLTVPTVGTEGDVQASLMVVAVTKLQLLEVLAEVVGDNYEHLKTILSDMCDVSSQFPPCQVEVLHAILFHPDRLTYEFSSMRLRFMGHFPMHHATTPENIRSKMRGLGGSPGAFGVWVDVKPTVRAVVNLIEWAIGHPETHHRATLFDRADGARILRRFLRSTKMDTALASDVVLMLVHAHSAGLIDLGEELPWSMLLANMVSRYRLLSEFGGSSAVIAALAARPAIDEAVRYLRDIS